MSEARLIMDDNGDYAEISDLGEFYVATLSGTVLDVEIPPVISDINSTSTTLGASATFTGSAERINGYGIIYINVYSDVASSTDGLHIEQSSDGTNWDHCDEYTVPANSGKNYSINPHAKYLRVIYINGPDAQTEFRLQTILKATGLASSHRIADAIIDDDDAELVTNVNKAKRDDGTYVNIGATNSNNLRVTDAESGLAIAKGDVTSTTFVHKFGNAPDFDASDGIITIWDGADDNFIDQMTYVYSTSDDIDSVSSSSASDTFDLEIQGLDVNGDIVVQTVSLSGQTRVPLSTNLFRAFRMKNINSTDNVGHIYCYENTAIVSGVPSDSTKVRAIIQPTNNQTLMSLYTVPQGKTAYVRSWYGSIAGANKTSNYVVDIRAREFEKVFQLKHRSSLADNGTSYIHHKYEEPPVYPALTDIEIRCRVTASGATAASVSAGFDIVLVDN